MLDFTNNTNTWPMQAVGRVDGENAVKQGEGFMFKQMSTWKNTPSLKSEFPRVSDYIDAVAIGQSRYYTKLRREETYDKSVEESLKPKH